jgi:hypothetical protein
MTRPVDLVYLDIRQPSGALCPADDDPTVEAVAEQQGIVAAQRAVDLLRSPVQQRVAERTRGLEVVGVQVEVKDP